MRFVNTSAAERIAAAPRAVYRVVIERAPGAALSYLTGVLKWRQVVQQIIDGSSNPAAYPLGGNVSAVLDRDTVATLDYQAKTNPGTATVADLVNAIAAASPYARIVSVERRGPVPGASLGGADAIAAERDAVTQRERERYAQEGPAAALASGVRTVRNVLIVAVVAGVLYAVYRLTPTPLRSAAP